MRPMPWSSLCTRMRIRGTTEFRFARITNQLGFKTTRTVAQGIAEIARLVQENVIANFADAKYRN